MQVARTQALVAAVVALALWPTYGAHAAASALLGGLVPVCATLCMGVMMFIASKQTPRHVLAGFFVGEAGRLAVVGLLLWAIFAFTTAAPGYVLAAFILGLVMQSVACMRNYAK